MKTKEKALYIPGPKTTIKDTIFVLATSIISSGLIFLLTKFGNSIVSLFI